MERGFDVCSPRGGRHSRKSNWSMATIFLSTPSARRATAQHGVTQCPLQISTHALREEGDGIDLGIKDKDLQFLSTPSARRATLCRWAADHRWRISIHALREEGDATARDTTCRRMNFYPRPPRGGRQSSPYIWMMVLTFLSTPSARRATATRSLPGWERSISIHALREEGDIKFAGYTLAQNVFLSTPSARRATRLKNAMSYTGVVFLSTPSARRATSWTPASFWRPLKFLSTPSARRAT